MLCYASAELWRRCLHAFSHQLALVASAPFADPNISNTIQNSAGTVFTFLKNSTGQWNMDQTLTAESSKAFDNLGASMDLNSDGTQLLVSAHGDDAAGSGAGALHIFAKGAGGKFALQKTVFHKDST
jgi:hypothetical protein